MADLKFKRFSLLSSGKAVFKNIFRIQIYNIRIQHENFTFYDEFQKEKFVSKICG